MRFHYEHEGQRCGPCTVGQLRNMSEFGGLSLETRVSAEGNDRWISLGSLLHSQSVPAVGQDRSQEAPATELARPAQERPLGGRERPAPIAFGQSPGGRPIVRSASGGTKTRALFVVLAVAMGPMGVHNFYAGYKKRGVSQLLISVFLGWMIFPMALVFFWVLVEIFTVEKDAAGVPFG